MQRPLNQRAGSFWLFPSWKPIRRAYEKNRMICKLIANHPVFKFEAQFFPSLSSSYYA
ncbi:hypothetical protein LRU_01592 [Ligilactobacillus ruminis SPM0211]|uniref:Uncharacterized protein n=1 Tax=Ligilactobacillus ruminis SPM0211 TaxID=1040964 RepID=F7R1L8_9LACO|nr:hypothetical protein LRU_01592 [Ligilactobacillus ruminis SPM0211]